MNVQSDGDKKSIIYWKEVIDEIRNFGSQESSFEEYDSNWMFTLFVACLDNMNRYFLQEEIDSIGENLNQEEKSLLSRIVKGFKVQ